MTQSSGSPWPSVSASRQNDAGPSVSESVAEAVTVTVAVGTVYAAWDVDDNGFAFGAGVELVSNPVTIELKL